MKVLVVAPRFHSNLYFPLQALKTRGHELTFLILYAGALEDYYDVVIPKPLGFSTVFKIINRLLNAQQRVGYLKTNFELKYGFPPLVRLWHELWQTQPDVVLIKNISSLFSLITALLARLLGCRVLFMLQIDAHRAQKSGSVTWVGQLFGAKVLTPLLGDPARYPNHNSNLLYVPFVIEPSEAREHYFAHGRINILTVGKFVARKNHLLLLEAFAALAPRYPLHLTIVGEQAEEQYVRRVDQSIVDHGLTGRVTLKFNLTFQATLNEYEQHDIFVLASSDEAAAVSPLEAMSRGLAVISSSANGTRCYIEEGKNGYIFQDKNLDDLIVKLEYLLKDRAALVAAGQTSLALVRDRHNPVNFAKKFEQLTDMIN